MALIVNGPSEIKTGTGSSSALESLGWGSAEGVDMELIEHFLPVHTDRSGDQVGADEQRNGVHAIIRTRLTDYTESVLAKLRVRSQGLTDDTTSNTPGAVGAFLGGGGLYHRLLITSTIAGTPFNFLTARLLSEPTKARLGSKWTFWDVAWYVYAPPGSVLYNRTTT
jgi:hypothetical protein